MRNPDLLTAALAAAARGWHVFPLRPGDKRPAVKDWEARATTDTERVMRCWLAGPYNIGIACGPSELLVVGLDTPKADTSALPAPFDAPDVRDGADVLAVLAERHQKPFPTDTYAVRTGRGGEHLYFTVPDATARNTASRLGPLIDTRAAGGYVVAAGSIVDGNPYHVIHDGTVQAFPGWIARLLAPVLPPRRPGPLTVGAFHGGARLVPLVAYVLDAVEGTRNSSLYWAAGKAWGHIRAGQADEHAALQSLLDAALAVGLTEREAHATIVSAGRQ